MSSKGRDFGTIRESDKFEDPDKAKTDEQPDANKQSTDADFRRNKDGIYGGTPERREQEQPRKSDPRVS